MGACHRTSDRQEHKIIWCAGPERDMTFHLRVTKRVQRACKATTVAMSLGNFTVAGDFVLQLIRLESLGSELQES